MEVSPEKIQRKIKQAGDLGSVVKMMKAIASSKIGEYQRATRALDEFYRTLLLGMHAYLRHHPAPGETQSPVGQREGTSAVFLVFGSDQGLVGPFNNTIVEFFKKSRPAEIKHSRLWVVGDRVSFILKDLGIPVDITFPAPHSVENITPFVANVLSAFDAVREKEHIGRIYAFFNRPGKFEGYTPVRRQILPLGKEWRTRATQLQWPSNHLPQIIGDHGDVFSAIFREYLFTSFYRACAFSLSSENTSRLNAMIRAESNIEEINEKLRSSYHQLRQDAIDTELFDVIAGFKFLSSS